MILVGSANKGGLGTMQAEFLAVICHLREGAGRGFPAFLLAISPHPIGAKRPVLHFGMTPPLERLESEACRERQLMRLTGESCPRGQPAAGQTPQEQIPRWCNRARLRAGCASPVLVTGGRFDYMAPQ